MMQSTGSDAGRQKYSAEVFYRETDVGHTRMYGHHPGANMAEGPTTRVTSVPLRENPQWENSCCYKQRPYFRATKSDIDIVMSKYNILFNGVQFQMNGVTGNSDCHETVHCV